MIIKIESQQLNYEPGFSPQNKDWRKRLSWYTEKPQQIGPYQCFVKRFEQLPAGWELVHKLVDQENTGIPKVLATATADESGETAHYLLHEYLPGKTLKKCLKEGININGMQLLENLWQGLHSIHRRGFWHTDFTEENIYLSDHDNRFYIIDLDSTTPLSIAPSSIQNTPGGVINQEGAIAAMQFIRAYIDPDINSFEPFGGMLLNQLQLIILLTKLHFLLVQDKPLPNKEVRAELPKHLKHSGPIAERYINTFWKHRDTRALILPVVKTILLEHFPELKKNVYIKIRN